MQLRLFRLDAKILAHFVQDLPQQIAAGFGGTLMRRQRRVSTRDTILVVG